VNEEGLSKEQRVLRVLRKVLANIVKDVTPEPGMPHPLQESTVQDIRGLFGLIAEREAELARENMPGISEKPFYADQPQKNNVLKFHQPGKSQEPEEP
jgi:hypothetical protein